MFTFTFVVACTEWYQAACYELMHYRLAIIKILPNEVVFTARCYAERGMLSVCPSVSLVDCDHSGRNSSNGLFAVCRPQHHRSTPKKVKVKVKHLI